MVCHIILWKIDFRGECVFCTAKNRYLIMTVLAMQALSVVIGHWVREENHARRRKAIEDHIHHRKAVQEYRIAIHTWGMARIQPLY